MIETYKNDFIRFMEKLISISRGDKKLYLIKLYLKYNDNELMNLELVMYEIDYDHHNNAFNWLMKLNPTNELIEICPKQFKRIKSMTHIFLISMS